MDFLQCYQMLDLQPGCSWDELQTAYRRLVQKWHPDRFESQPDQLEFATQRIIELNAAFEILSQHYSDYGHLPGARVPAHRSASPEIKRGRAQRTAAMNDSSRKTPRWLLALICIALSYAMYVAYPDKSHEQLHPADNGSLSSGPNGTSAQMSSTATAPSVSGVAPATAVTADAPTAPVAHFTYGDTPGKVFEVQGVPTRTAGDIWFYGVSEVHFSNGEVVSWYEAPGYPLKTEGTDAGAPSAATTR